MAVTEPAPSAVTTAHEGTLRRQPVREPAARTYARALPIVPVRARGLTVEGPDGRRYLDCLSGAGTLPLGHNHPVVLEAVRRALDSVGPSPEPDPPAGDPFVAVLRRTLPPGLVGCSRIRFCGPTGTRAVQEALALARAATGRDGLLVDGAGRTAPSAVRTEPFHDDPGPDAPHPAAVLLEPVRGDTVLPVPDDLLRRTREVTAARGIPLIVDETRTGVGRTGTFWAVEHSGVTPDIMVLARSVGGSLPLAVLVHRTALDPGPGGAATEVFRGNRLARAAGAATLAHVHEHGLAARAGRLGAHMLDRLRELAAEHPHIGEVRGRGLLIGVELVDPETPAPAGTVGPSRAPALAAAVQRACLQRGLILGRGGPDSGVLRLLPPLTLTDEQATAVLDRLADALATTTARRPGP
ncbi:aminotransferase class III-fold pyridoxal phosphate-dependent enzyme [Streptomyces sp. NPDC002490]|uniref:aminotransferase class III-fold pyridoxal phosphate-dependent enzyme n=1 Tax=Streptomyces sp. NPDC002490 TaxID=3154416 RepID=UPI00331EA9AB